MKKGYPKIAVCLNKSHIKKTEELCKEYKQRYKALFQEMFGNIVTDFCRDEDYYANLRAATLKKIYGKSCNVYCIIQKDLFED